MSVSTPTEHRSGNRQKHESKNPIQRALIDRFHGQAAALIKRARPRTILDLGCGEGYAISALLDAGVDAEFTGIDLSEGAIDFARERLGDRATLECADARDLAADGRRFDMVMMLEVLEHIPEPAKILPIVERLTRHHVLFSVPWEPFFCGLNLARGKNVRRLGNDPEHVNHWTRAGFTSFVGRRFRVLDTPLVFPWSMVLAERLSAPDPDLRQ